MTSIHKQTLLASCLATVAVIPALIPAALLVIVYTSFLGSILSGPTWYPDFVNEVALIWFPELLRGMVAGSVALLATKYFFPAANKQIAAISAGAFWGGASVLIAVFSWLVVGFTADLIGVLAMAIGLAVGLWIAQNDDQT
ncbi:hypothetical protein [Shimia abyssi]|uniref:Uncharacterized protein n=1 Tax=Shimia abyssi TaxID=1662395 RepID=A0A2P8FFI8_9RHOB|nr:hypothetical protein [Shimia abyssi]PSL20473.1 hypothetical protein CLV88_103116 [Shimia abyssi]